MALEPLKRLDVRLFVVDPNAVGWTDAIPLFTRWLQEEPDRWLDVADYRHVPTGPKVLLVGKECHVALDDRRHEPSLLVSRREPYDGTNTERIVAAFRDAFAVAERVSSELPAIRFRRDVCEFAVNDRVTYPNERDIADAVEAELRSAISVLMPGTSVTLERDSNPKERVTFRVRVAS